VISYDKTLEILGAVDTEIFSRLYRGIINRDTLQCINIIDDMTLQGKELTQFVTDFVWYLRNIMLLIASPDTASMIDISTENMARLKDDAANSELDSVIRFIKVFSDLVNQIRYASQKRVYVEIAFIRCCEPRMAIKDPESLTDRVAALEKRIEEGRFNAGYIPAENSETGAVPVRSDVKMPDAPKAVPDDIRKLIECWPRVIADCNVDMAIRDCKPVLSDDGKLILYFPSGHMGARLLNNEDQHRDLSAIFENYVGAVVDFSVQDTESDEMFEAGLYDLRNLVKPGTVNVPIDTESDTEEF
jgi:DNA polymerase-3 subunit gamma/tau